MVASVLAYPAPLRITRNSPGTDRSTTVEPFSSPPPPAPPPPGFGGR